MPHLRTIHAWFHAMLFRFMILCSAKIRVYIVLPHYFVASSVQEKRAQVPVNLWPRRSVAEWQPFFPELNTVSHCLSISKRYKYHLLYGFQPFNIVIQQSTLRLTGWVRWKSTLTSCLYRRLCYVVDAPISNIHRVFLGHKELCGALLYTAEALRGWQQEEKWQLFVNQE